MKTCPICLNDFQEDYSYQQTCSNSCAYQDIMRQETKQKIVDDKFRKEFQALKRKTNQLEILKQEIQDLKASLDKQAPIFGHSEVSYKLIDQYEDWGR